MDSLHGGSNRIRLIPILVCNLQERGPHQHSVDRMAIETIASSDALQADWHGIRILARACTHHIGLNGDTLGCIGIDEFELVGIGFVRIGGSVF